MISEGPAGAPVVLGEATEQRRVGAPNLRGLLDGRVPRKSWAVPLLLTTMIVVGAGLRLPWFGDSLYGDEVGAFFDVSGHSLGRVLYLLSGHSPELNPPLYFVVAWASERLFGTSAQSLRLISLLSGMAAIPLTYLLGSWTVGRRAGMAAAAIVTLCPFLVFYSSEARPYGLMLVLCLGSTLGLLKALRSGGRGWWVVYGAASCAAMYTHFTSVFLLVAQFCWAFVTHASSRRALLAANLGAAVGFAPWLPNLVRTAHSPGTRLYGTLDPFTLDAVRLGLGHLWFGSPEQPITTIPGLAAVALALAGLGCALLGVLVATRGSSRIRLCVASPFALVLLLAFAAPLGAGLYSAFRPSVWDSRNLISSWPGFAVLLGAILTHPRTVWRVPALALVLAAFAIGSIKMLSPSYHRPNYEAAAGYINQTGTDHEPVVNWPDFSPGPPSELEVALDIQGSARRHPVLRLGAAPLAEVLRAPPYTSLLPQPGETVAHEAVSLARSGKFYLVLPGFVPLPVLEAVRRKHISSRPTSGILALLGAFLGALPARFHPVAVRSYQGLHHVTVYVFQSQIG